MSILERFFKILFVVLVVSSLYLILFGGGSKPVQTLGIPPARIIIPPQSSVTPEGAQPQAPPVSLPRATLGQKHIDMAGLRLIEQFEGYSRCAYFDPYGRVWTVGFGQTHGAYAGFCFSGRAAAEANLKASVESEYEWALRDLGVALNQHQWDALCSFVWNLGAGIFEGTTVGADLRARAFYAASRQMLAYDHAGGVVLAGLRTRREDEVRLFLEPESKPKPPSRAQLKAQLKRELKRRAGERSFLTDHHCRQPPWHSASPNGHWEHACHVELQHGRITNKIVRDLKAKGA